MAHDTQEYVAALKQSGADDQGVVAILRNAGWSEKDAVAVLASYYEARSGCAVPIRPSSIGGPREAFLHLLTFATLAVWCLAAGSLWFTLIDFWLVDPAAPVFGDPLAGMARGLASVLVAFPIFLLVMRAVWRELIAGTAETDSLLRRWLTYMALFLAAGTLIGDLVAFVEHLLRGELTSRFVAKVVTVLVLAGGVFWFYVRSVQVRPADSRDLLRRHGRLGAAIAGVFVLATLAFSFTQVGSPAAQRLAASDDRRSEDLEAIARIMRLRWTAGGQTAPMLPARLQDLPESSVLRLNDPITGEPYRYRPVNGARYELCARFQTDTTRTTVGRARTMFQIHPAGDHCFAVDAVGVIADGRGPRSN